jgi:hypothetical protein
VCRIELIQDLASVCIDEDEVYLMVLIAAESHVVSQVIAA